MSVTNVAKNPKDLTLIITSEFDAAVERVWELWENPRQLEKWWGPPTWPATFVDYNLKPGGDVNYYMTGPDGTRAGGWWRVTTIDAPHNLEFEDGFSDDAGAHNSQMPTMIVRVALSAKPAGGTRMDIETTFSSVADMDQMITMGMDEGMSAAVGQMDALLG